MPNAYREIFQAPGSMAFSGAGFLARLPVSMITIGIVAMLSQTHGQYWLAGAVSATFAFSNALISPRVSRLVDRHGQRRVLVPATALAVAALAGLILATHLRAPIWTLFLFAVAAGVMPSMMALVRARWTEIYRGTAKLHTAFAFESVVDEAVYIAGPVLGIGLSVSLFPEAGPLAATFFLAVGMALFVAQRSTEPPVHPQEGNRGRSILRLVPLRILMLALAAMGVIFGTAEVATVAFAEAEGQKAAPSLVLAVYAAGSMVVGLVFGTMRFEMPLARQLTLSLALAAATTLPLPFVGNVHALGLALFFAGAAISPTIITTMGLIERIVPPAELTEGITWSMTGMGLGMAIGASASGYVVDLYGAASGYWVSVAAGAVGLTTVLAGFRSLQGEERRSELRHAPA